MLDLIQLIKNGEVDHKYLTKAKDERSSFLEGKEVDRTIVPQEVITSWKRCKSWDVYPYTNKVYVFDSSEKKKVNQFQDVISTYKFFFKSVLEIFELTTKDFEYFTLRTKDGKCEDFLKKEGFLGNKYQLSNLNCSEKKVGTTSGSIAHIENRNVILFGALFYRQPIEIHGASAPIHNHENDVIGTLNLGFSELKLSLKSWYLVSLIAKVFDSLYLPLTMGYEKQIQQIFDFLPQGIALVDEKNTIKFCNEKIVELAEIKKKHHYELIQLKKDQPKVQSMSRKIKDDINKENLKLIQIQKNESLKLGTYRHRKNGLFSFEEIKGNSAIIRDVKKTALEIADTSASVILHGESGTGKEMFAQAIHRASSRCNGPFIAINCGAIPRELVESELFGYEEGSFTGALKGGKIGKIQTASGGTLFLDEIESMPLRDQIKLLRVLSTGKVQKIGGTKEIPVDIRLISATKTDLLKQCDEGLFREDLFYRISTFIVELPALRERREDIILLAEEFIQRQGWKYSRSSIKMDQLFMEALCRYNWRGNVRELEHAMEHAVILLKDGSKLLFEHLPARIRNYYKENTPKEIIQKALGQAKKEKGLLSIVEELMIEHVLNSVNGNFSLAAKELGITRRTLYNKLNKK